MKKPLTVILTALAVWHFYGYGWPDFMQPYVPPILVKSEHISGNQDSNSELSPNNP